MDTPMTTLAERAESYRRAFPRWPAPRVDERWIDGVWVLGQNYRNKTPFYGAYPPGYLKRVRALFPTLPVREQVLHVFGGSLGDGSGADVPGLTVDLRPQLLPAVVGNAEDLRASFPAGGFQLVLADPPYSSADAEKYDTPMVNRRRVLSSIRGVTAAGGNLVWLDTVLPQFKKADWRWWGCFMIVRSTMHRVRGCFLFEAV